MDREEIVATLTRLVMAHSPSGHEDEIQPIIMEEFRKRGDEVWMDPAGNVLCRIAGRTAENRVIVTAHMDEIGMLVKRIEDGGILRVARVGGAWPYKYGEGPVDILGDYGTATGVLSTGSSHITKESKDAWAARNDKPLDWDMVWVETKMTREQLAEKGIHTGTKLVVGKARKTPVLMGDYIGAYGLDCKGGVVALFMLAERLKRTPPAHDVVLAATREEEIGCVGALYVAHHVPAETMIALEIGVTGEEFGVANTAEPIIYYSGGTMYDEGIAKRMTSIARGLGFGVQHATLTGGTDAGYSHANGLVARGCSVGFATDNSHGYEIGHLGGLENMVEMVAGYLE